MSPRILSVTAGPAQKRNSMCAALHALYGAEVLPGMARTEGRIERAYRKFGLDEHIGAHAANIRALNRNILERAGTFNILFVVKGNFVTADTLRLLRARADAPRIIGWSCDDVYLPHNSSSVLRSAAPFYDIFFTAKSLNISQAELVKLGFRDARFLHQGFDVEVHRPLPNPHSPFAGLVTFVGFGEEDRFNKMNVLARNGIDVHVWGNGWTRALRARANHHLHIHGHPLLGDDYAEVLSNSAINLCFLRKINRDLHTSRTFEIPACGGFMVAERTDEHRAYFEEDTEAVYFGDERELLCKVQYYLRHPEERVNIAVAARQRCLDSDYSYRRLAQKIIEQVAETHTKII